MLLECSAILWCRSSVRNAFLAVAEPDGGGAPPGAGSQWTVGFGFAPIRDIDILELAEVREVSVELLDPQNAYGATKAGYPCLSCRQVVRRLEILESDIGYVDLDGTIGYCNLDDEDTHESGEECAVVSLTRSRPRSSSIHDGVLPRTILTIPKNGRPKIPLHPSAV